MNAEKMLVEFADKLTTKEIQDLVDKVKLDAYKAGMLKAARIAEIESDKVCHEDPFAHTAIEFAANNLTIKDIT